MKQEQVLTHLQYWTCRVQIKGFLVPRVTSEQRNLIGTTQGGLLVYDTDTDSFWYYNNLEADWSEISTGSVEDLDDLTDAKTDEFSIFIGENAGAK